MTALRRGSPLRAPRVSSSAVGITSPMPEPPPRQPHQVRVELPDDVREIRPRRVLANAA